MAYRVALGGTILDHGYVESLWVGQIGRRLPHVRVQVRIPAAKADRILGDEALQSRVIVARSRVAPTASRAGKSTPNPMRVAPMDDGVGRGRACDLASATVS